MKVGDIIRTSSGRVGIIHTPPYRKKFARFHSWETTVGIPPEYIFVEGMAIDVVFTDNRSPEYSTLRCDEGFKTFKVISES